MKYLFAIAALSALTAGQAYASCTYPPPPDKIPDGRTATKAEMITAELAVKAYDKAINAYNDCLALERDDRIAKAGDKLTQKQKDELREIEAVKHNAAIDELQSIADRFNEQVRIFKARTDKTG